MLKTPLEDFTTEILTGILTTYPEIGNEFAVQMLRLDGEHFSYSTQEHFLSPENGDPDCRVDLVVRTEGTVCFVENKVESREGYIQLHRYKRVLDGLNADYKTYLKYCTKYYDDKQIEEHEFHQFRWADVFRFLNQWKSSELISHFLEFLKDHDMSDDMNITIADLLTMQGMNETVKKMDRYLEKIRPIFGRSFDTARIKDSSNLKQIKSYSRYIFHADGIFGESGYSEIGAGFDFSEVPALKVWIWVSEKNSKAALFKQALSTTEMQNNGENWLGCSAALSDYISASEMEQDVEAWFADAFDKIKSFQASNAQLNWHI